MAVLGLLDLVALVLEDLRQGAADPAFIVDYEEASHSGARGWRVLGGLGNVAPIYRTIGNWFAPVEHQAIADDRDHRDVIGPAQAQ